MIAAFPPRRYAFGNRPALRPGGRLLIRSPGSLDTCRREQDYRNVTAFFENWRYNFFGANLLVFKMRRHGFDRIRFPAAAFIGARLDGSAGVGMARPADTDTKRIEKLMSVGWVRVPPPHDEL